MLTDLANEQGSEEHVWTVDLSFDIETRSQNGDIIIRRVYTFRYAEEWDKWTLFEYSEEKTEDTDDITDRNWRESKHLTWDDPRAIPEIDVPPEVSDELAKATGSSEVTIQVPSSMLDDEQN